jgi:Glycosyl transferase family 2
MSPPGDLAVVIPARNESDRVGATVRAAARISGVDVIVVVDDGSTDGTGSEAAAAGATVVRHARNRGKAAAMETGAEAVLVIEAERAPAAAWKADREDGATLPGGTGGRREGGAALPGGSAGRREGAGDASAGAQSPAVRPRHLLFLDADLAETAERAGRLAEPVVAGRADMSIAVFSTRVKRGGHGLVIGLSGAGIERATGWRPAEPLNGQRCLTRAAFEAARPLASGWGAETGLTIDLLSKGMRIEEVQVAMAHRATGRDFGSQVHRARQLAGVARALAARQPWRRATRRPDAQVTEAVGPQRPERADLAS